MESILNSIKKLLGIDEEYKIFDTDVMMCINAVFGTLHQLGAGPSDGFKITGEDETWDSYLTYGQEIEEIKTYVYLRTRLLFDPPDRGAILGSFQEQIRELEWRIVVKVDEYRGLANE